MPKKQGPALPLVAKKPKKLWPVGIAKHTNSQAFDVAKKNGHRHDRRSFYTLTLPESRQCLRHHYPLHERQFWLSLVVYVNFPEIRQIKYLQGPISHFYKFCNNLNLWFEPDFGFFDIILCVPIQSFLLSRLNWQQTQSQAYETFDLEYCFTRSLDVGSPDWQQYDRSL